VARFSEKFPTIDFASCELIIGKVLRWSCGAGLAPAREETTETLLLHFCKIDKSMSAKTKRRTGKSRRWSARVTKRSNALDLEPKVFRSSSPRKIALSLKRSAERSKRRKAKPYQSAMSMLNFYINRAGKNLPKKRQRVLERAKDELREVFRRE